ncbi:hypothetical protein CLIB1444_07S05798 [[Candida] jaroonii]|uniref:Uncharacterized protein n=1 Tax=[Candida] jaroonii TaxID=467808 RepID=A0ACA9YB15_9ASCO|nr:hypothetical protein CLIB1444_07S05798 [[Candida] jaroonii]
MLRIKPLSRCLVRVPRLTFRLYSDQKYNKYKNIEEFNNSKTEYNFNKKFDNLKTQNSDDIHSKVYEAMEQEEQININEMIEKDPRLQGIEPNSPEYKELLDEINHEYRRERERQNNSEERREKFKAIGGGLSVAVGLVMVHQFMFNWDWYKARVFKSWYDIDEDKLKTKKNSKDFSFLKSKLQDIIKGDFIANCKDSESSTGLYLFGSQNNQKLPTRIPFFDDMTIKDVEIDNDLLVVIDDYGKLYQTTGSKTPELIKLPFKVEKCHISPEYLYLLTSKGELSITPRIDKSLDFEGSRSRNWLGVSQQYDNNYISFFEDKINLLNKGEKIQDIAGGISHLLMLTNKGRVFTMKTNEGDNFGQFGLPQYSPINDPKIPVNKPFELTLLNNEIKVTRSNKSIQPRFFTSIASGNHHNIVSDSNGNVWTWGKNSYGQCGKDVSYKTSVQSVPERILSLDDFTYICKKQYPKVKSENFSVEQVYANAETSLIKLNYRDGNNIDDLVLSMGNGVKGQLGINRFLHVSNTPKIIKSIINSEFNEEKEELQRISVDSITCGKNHTIMKLNNVTDQKDVVVFGDNEFGQLGNGKLIKTSKPSSIPKLIEPEDLGSKDISNLTRKINDPNNRLQLKSLKIKKTQVTQTIKACGDSSVIYYKRT